MDKATLDILEKILSKERFSYWKRFADGDREKALMLHRRNAVVASILFADVQFVEIALRNELDRELQKVVSPDWLDDPQFEEYVLVAKSKAKYIDTPSNPRDKIIVGVSLGSWVKLWEKHHDNIPGAFKNDPDPRKLIRDLKSLRNLRNDMAHHEPILEGTRRRDLKKDIAAMDRILRSIDPKAADWLRANSLFRQLVEQGLASVSSKQHTVELDLP